MALLERRGLEFEAIDVGDSDGCCRLHELTGGRSVPQAVVDGRPIGGYDELDAWLRTLAPQPRGATPAATSAAEFVGLTDVPDELPPRTGC